MKKLAFFGIISFVGLLLASGSVIADPAGPPGGLDVNIINPLPVPVEGNVTATIPEPLDVNVVNVPTVQPSVPKQPYQEQFADGYSGDSSSWRAETDQVPPGKRLTVEFLSIYYVLTESTEVNVCRAWVLSQPGCDVNLPDKLLYQYNLPVSFALRPDGSPSVPYEVFNSMPVLMYVEEGGSLCVSCSVPEGNNVISSGIVTISGHIEDAD